MMINRSSLRLALLDYVKRIDHDAGRRIHTEFLQLSEELRRQAAEPSPSAISAQADLSPRTTHETNENINTANIDRLLRGSLSLSDVANAGDEDLTSFSTGGDIFGEIAAAAAVSSGTQSFLDGVGDSSEDDREEDVALAHLLPGKEASTNTREDKLANDLHISEAVDAAWVPKVSTDGRIFYYNTRTGDSAFELPSPSVSSQLSKHIRADSGRGESVDGSSEYLADGDDEKGELTASETIKGLAKANGNSHRSSLTQDLLTSSGMLPSTSQMSNFGQPSVRAISMYSDDSVLDTCMASPKKGKAAETDAALTPRKFSLATSVNQQDPSALLEPFQANINRLEQLNSICRPRGYSSLASLEEDCNASLTALSQAIQRTRSADMGNFSVEEQEVADRTQLEEASARVNHSTRRLLAATDLVLEQSHSKRSSAASSSELYSSSANTRSSATLVDADSELISLPTLHASDFRPLAMKITATQSKLMLSIRTAWGLLVTSPAEEMAVERNREAENLPPDVLIAHKKARQQLLTARKDIDAKLRFDLLVQVRTLGDALINFVDEVEAFAGRAGLQAKKEALLAPKATKAELHSSTTSVLLPSVSIAGAFRGHGYTVPAETSSNGKRSRPASYSSLSSYSPASTLSGPTRMISREALQDLDAHRKSVLDDLNGLRTIFSTLFGSHASDSSIRPSLLPTITAQTCQFVNKLAKFSKDVEDIDLASQVDVGISPELFSSLVGESLAKVLESGLFSHETAATPESYRYQQSLDEAGLALRTLRKSRSGLASIPSSLLRTIQALSQAASPLSLPRMSISSSPAQPPQASPLGGLQSLQAQSGVNLKSVLDVFSAVDQETTAILSSLTDLLRLAEEQSQAAASLRRRNTALRAAIVDLRTPKSATSTNSSIMINRLKRRSANGGLGLEDEAHAQQEVINSQRTPVGDTRNSAASSSSVQRLGSAQSIVSRNGYQTRASRSNSLADSFNSETSTASRRADAAEELRSAIADAGICKFAITIILHL